MIRPLALVGFVAGLVLPVGAAPAAVAGCAVEDASLHWGFKESFRAYVDGSIANGGWTVEGGAGYATPEFSWSDGAGALGPHDLAGEVAFTGSVRFTGHGGILDTTIADPVLRFDGPDRATIVLDVRGPTMDGDLVEATGVDFAEIDLGGVGVLARRGDAIVGDTAPAVLTEEGSRAFPDYEAGTELDPVSFEIAVGSECAIEPGAMPDAMPWVALIASLAGILVLGGLGAAVGLLVSRRSGRGA